MRYLSLRALIAFLVVLVLLVFAVDPTMAQTAPAAPVDTSSGVLASIVVAVLAALPGLAIGAWALFKAYAAKSAAMWDDEAVAFVEKLAKGVVDASAAATGGATAAPSTTAPVTGVDH